MPAYIQGNLALDPKTKPKVRIKETTKVVYRSKALPVQEKMLYLFTVVLCVIVAGVIIWRYAQIYEMNANILKMQKEISQIQAENSALKQEVEKLQSAETLKQKAAELGLGPADEEPAKQGASSTTSSKNKTAAANDKVAINR